MGPSTWAGLSGYCLIVIVIERPFRRLLASGRFMPDGTPPQGSDAQRLDAAATQARSTLRADRYNSGGASATLAVRAPHTAVPAAAPSRRAVPSRRT
eukprot:2629910-Prymnesium_polylepis.1